jgi:hypothetical protein
MSLLFRRRVRIGKGIYLNFSKRGMSLTAGVPGASVNFGPNGAYLNAGIPGTGLYSRQRISNDAPPPSQEPSSVPQVQQPLAGEIKSAEVESLTSMEFEETKRLIIEAYDKRRELDRKLSVERTKLFALQCVAVLGKVLIVGFFWKVPDEWVVRRKAIVAEVDQEREDCVIDLDAKLDTDTQALFKSAEAAFEKVAGSGRIWDTTSSVAIDRVRERSSASTAITRSGVKFDRAGISVLKSSHQPFHLGNANGPELFLYPAFILSRDSRSRKIGIIGYRDLEFSFADFRFVETESCPHDSERAGYTWKKVNKNGSPDRRFKDNYQIPIMLYGELELRSESGLNERFMISSHRATREFGAAFSKYHAAVNG